MFENVSFSQPLGAEFDSPGERGLGALSRLPRNRPNCLTIRVVDPAAFKPCYGEKDWKSGAYSFCEPQAWV
jgi:hypothetical protein